MPEQFPKQKTSSLSFLIKVRQTARLLLRHTRSHCSGTRAFLPLHLKASWKSKRCTRDVFYFQCTTPKAQVVHQSKFFVLVHPKWTKKAKKGAPETIFSSSALSKRLKQCTREHFLSQCTIQKVKQCTREHFLSQCTICAGN